MLSLAIKAGIPIIRVQTSDILNLPDVLTALAPDRQIMEVKSTFPAKGDLLYAIEEYRVTRNTYEVLSEGGKVLLLVNQGDDTPFAFDAGEIPVPKALMVDLLSQVCSEKAITELLPCFNGLTLKGMAEVIQLVTAQDKSLTARGVTAMRAMLTGKLQGLGQVSTDMPLYRCPLDLKAWVDLNRGYFLEASDARLIPRGVLLHGDPGVGKSQASKYIANEFGVPLYRLDFSSSLGKWVGQSESNLSRILSTLDQEEPCVMLIDEVEKIFAEREDAGVTSRMLSQLLWWLQEHTSRVLTVMTTNDLAALPKELYRAGRIDRTIRINKLSVHHAVELAKSVLIQFLGAASPDKIAVVSKAIKASANNKIASEALQMVHAEVVQMVYDLIKKNGWKK